MVEKSLARTQAQFHPTLTTNQMFISESILGAYLFIVKKYFHDCFSILKIGFSLGQIVLGILTFLQAKMEDSLDREVRRQTK